MKEIEVGEYVRTKDGIIDKVIIEYDGKCNNPNCSEKHISCKYNYYNEKDIVKHSKQLIDLIEIGDILELREYVDYFKKSEKIGISDMDMLSNIKQAIRDKKIEVLSILTKKQYMANCYKVGGEDESN